MSDSQAGAIPTLRMREPLGEFLGALEPGETFTYTYGDVVKLSGHSCPTVAGAYLMTLVALGELYPDAVPVRGEIEVTIGGPAGEGTWGPISQVVTLLTGAAPETGFGGLAGRYRRRGLLDFDPSLEGRLRFRRADSGAEVTVRYDPSAIPFSEDVGELLGRALPEGSSREDRAHFARVWQGRVKAILAGDPRDVVVVEG